MHGCFMVRNPARDTKETLLRMTLDYAESFPEHGAVLPHHGIPGTEAYKEALASGALLKAGLQPVVFDKDGFHRTTIHRAGLSSQALVDFCDQARHFRNSTSAPHYAFLRRSLPFQQPQALPRFPRIRHAGETSCSATTARSGPSRQAPTDKQ